MSMDHPGLTEPMIGAFLRRASEATHRVLLGRLHEAGFADVRPAHFELFRFPGPDGVHPTELAERVGLSKQALNPLLNDLESFGYLTREPDQGDGRQRVLRLTGRGVAFVAATKEILEDIETTLSSHLGSRRYQQMRQAVACIPDALIDEKQLRRTHQLPTSRGVPFPRHQPGQTGNPRQQHIPVPLSVTAQKSNVLLHDHRRALLSANCWSAPDCHDAYQGPVRRAGRLPGRCRRPGRSREGTVEERRPLDY